MARETLLLLCCRGEFSKKDDFHNHHSSPPEGTAGTWWSRSFYPLKSCKDFEMQVQGEEEFEEWNETWLSWVFLRQRMAEDPKNLPLDDGWVFLQAEEEQE